MHNIVLQMGLKHAGLKPVIKAQGEPIAADEVNLKSCRRRICLQLSQLKRLTRLSSLNHLTQPASFLLVGKMLRFTGDIWRNHPCCVVCMNELQVTKNPEWSQKVMNAIVKGFKFILKRISKKSRDCCQRTERNIFQ